MPLKGKIDLRSDTFTEPTPAMRQAMATCEVGDDVWELDPTVHELESLAASTFGKEAAIFVPSSVMANLIAVMAHTSGRGEEIIVGDRCHISLYEQGNVSTIGGVHVRTVRNLDDGTFDLSELSIKIRPKNVHFPVTSVVCVESSHNMCSGAAVPVQFFRDVRKVVGDKIRIHLDGARVFNSAVALGIPVSEYTAVADSVTVCLSKGLAAPIGSLLIGTKEFIAKARMLRKALGGGMRQAGVIACCGIIALKDMVGRLKDDHANALRLFETLEKIEGVIVSRPQTNIVKFSLSPSVYPGANLAAVAKEFEKQNVYMITVDEGRAVRAVTHYHVTQEDIDEAGKAVAAILQQVRDGMVVLADGPRVY